MAEWRRSDLALDVAVNLSAGDIADAGLGDAILRLLAEYRVAATSLVLEITESAMMRDPITAARNMELLRVAGVRFAIDDFGTGYSSLSQLRKLGCDYAQGYLISKPLPTNEVAGYVREANQALEDSDSTLIQVRALEILSSRR
jgi:EAL domain-containing protein (putative c-di-GMP-specific phosphodiesterase class I)